MVTQGEGYPYQDISWDGTHQLFIASGSHPAPQGLFSPGPFVELLEVDLSLVPNPVTTPVFHYNIHDQIVLGGGENKTLHAQIDNDHLILFHDLRKDSVDIVWLTLVRNYSTYNPYIFNSRHFQFPAHKLFAKDMVYDNLNNRLNLLTELMYCNENAMPQQLSQVNPYSLTGMRVIQLDGGYGVNAPCPSMADPNISIYGTLLDMNRLSFNHHNHCGPVLVSGVHYSSASILTETYDVSASACDTKLTIWESNDDPILFSQYSSPTASHISMTDIQAGFSNDYISVNTPCLDPNACSNQRANQSKGPHFMDTQTEAGVTVLDNRRFICNGFNGETTICMYDLTGKMMWCTSTFNELQNTFPTLNGLYILVAMDVWGNQVVCKVLIP